MPLCRIPRSIASCSCTRSKWRTTRSPCCARSGACSAAGGRLLIVVPNRRGVWARSDTTPFGHGRPYSRSQITHLLARGLVHADGMGRGAACAAGRARLVPALGGRPGSGRARRSLRRSPVSTSSRRRSRSIAPIPARRERARLVPALEPALAPWPRGALAAMRRDVIAFHPQNGSARSDHSPRVTVRLPRHRRPECPGAGRDVVGAGDAAGNGRAGCRGRSGPGAGPVG